MKKLILASVAAFVLTTGFANAGIILGSDEYDRKVWINTWAGQSEDKRSERYGSSASMFSGVVTYSNEKNTHEVFVGRFQGKPRSESVSTFSGRRSAGDSIRGMYKNTHEVWVRR
jgi:hypothetical protein